MTYPDTAPSRHTGRIPHLHEQILAVLTSDIIAGRLAFGQRLTETSIAERFDVSRGPARQALLALENADLVIRTRRGGLTVAKVTDADGKSTSPGRASELDNSASWEWIYEDAAAEASVHAVYGSWRIVETELADYYDVGRTVAREVLARMEHRGILRKQGTARWVLPKMTPERMTNLFEMRRTLEPVALRQAAETAPRAFLIDMRDELIEAMNSSRIMRPEEFDWLEQQLHVKFLSYASNDLVIDTLRNCQSLFLTNKSLYRATRDWFGSDPFPGEHLDVVESLLANDVESATAQLTAHMDASVKRVTERLTHAVANVEIEPLRYYRRIDPTP